MSLEQTADGLVITRQWRSPAGLLMIPLSILWIVVLIVLPSFTKGRTDLMITLVIPVMHVTMGIGISYLTLAHLINRTRIIVTHSHVSVAHGPLPWPGNRSVATAQINQFFCKEFRRRTNQGLQKRYQVWVLMSDGTQSKLVDLGLAPERALYIEQQIEMALNIQDREVPDELPR